MNPYLDRAELKEDLMQSFSKSINSLSKNTAEDKQNKVNKNILQYNECITKTKQEMLFKCSGLSLSLKELDSIKVIRKFL